MILLTSIILSHCRDGFKTHPYNTVCFYTGKIHGVLTKVRKKYHKRINPAKSHPYFRKDSVLSIGFIVTIPLLRGVGVC